MTRTAKTTTKATRSKAPSATADAPDATYAAFLASKLVTATPSGFDVPLDAVNAALFPFQRHIVRWALRIGKAALFEETGLGKTGQQLEWARHVHLQTGRDVLIFAPLAVAEQTKREAAKLLGMDIAVCRTQADVQPGVNITNYEMLSHFDTGAFAGVVIDEASILKSYDGKTRKALTDFAADIPYRLVATATPAPNDVTEIANYAEFLGVMSGKEILALFFTQDGNTAHNFRLKGHAKGDFYTWLASWAVALRKPSDLGFDDTGYDLPPLTIEQHTTEGRVLEGRLFAVEAQTLSERQQARRESVDERVQMCADLVNASTEPWIVWCGLNSESAALANAIPDAVEVTGSDSAEHKAKAMLDFSEGRIRVLVSKSSICGWGMNWQHCRNVAFVGISDSWEQYYQAIRRCWRFGQERPVTAHVIVSETEGAVVANIERKERVATALLDGLIAEVAKHIHLEPDRTGRNVMEYNERVASGRDWTLYLGDCVEMVDALEDASVGLVVTSPPFPGMYAYTNSPRDMGNARDMDEMLKHYRFLVSRKKLLRAMMPGRMMCVHLTQSPAFKSHDGYVGLKDFRGRVIDLMTEEGWIYYGEVTIDKNPQVKAQRTKERGLMFKTLATDSSLMRMAMADYLLYFMAPGDNPKPIRAGIHPRYNPDGGWITTDEWIEWAHPVWYGVNETDVLNVKVARESDDERHLCPLQLPVIERAVKLWSAPGDMVVDPFNGIGSTGHQSLLLRRRYTGFELKPSYFETAVRNLTSAEHEASAATLWDGLDVPNAVEAIEVLEVGA